MERPAVETSVADVDAAIVSGLALARVQNLLEQARNQQTAQVTFRMKAKLAMGDSIKIVGDACEMGRWVPEVAYYAKWNAGDIWEVTMPIRLGKYKYKACVRKPRGVHLFEEGEDRWLELDGSQVFQPLTIEFEPRLAAQQ